MTADAIQAHRIAAPRSVVEPLIRDETIRARWAPAEDAGARLELFDDGAGVRLQVSGSADWAPAFRKLDQFVAALKQDARCIVFSRLLKHPLPRVFQAFTTPEGRTHWWGPMGFSTTTRSMQFEVGGTWDFTMHGPDGRDYPNFVRYTAIEANRLIAYDHGTAADQPPKFKAEIRFAEEPDGTRVTLRLILNDAAERPDYVRFGAVEGGYDTLSRLDRWLAASPEA